MKILLVGSGAREHAIAEALVDSCEQPELFAYVTNRNPGILRIAKGYKVGDINNPKAVADYAEEINADFAFIGPEEPSFHGVPNELEERGIACVGASKEVAILEMSKAEMRRLMWKYKIPGRLPFKVFQNIEDALAYIDEYAESVAVKPARQAGGKGVKVIADLQAYLQNEKKAAKKVAAKKIFEEHMKPYIEMQDKILIEEKIEGPEYTLHCFADGKHLKAMPMVQDNKHAFEEDIGPETGGMGSIKGKGEPLPFLTQKEFDVSAKIIEKMVLAIQDQTSKLYKGVVAGQMMLSYQGPTIIEMYSRFGDPEAVNILPILDVERGADLVEICEAIIHQNLNQIKIKFREVATVVKCIAPEGYPDHRDLATGHEVYVDEKAIEALNCKVYYATVDKTNGAILTGGARVVELYAESDDIVKASRKLEAAVKHIKLLDGWPLFHRSDIGSKELLQKRFDLARLMREIYQYRLRKGLIGYDIDWIPGKGKIETEF
jgi:phosphoribosylamine--glycine ligase